MVQKLDGNISNLEQKRSVLEHNQTCLNMNLELDLLTRNLSRFGIPFKRSHNNLLIGMM